MIKPKYEIGYIFKDRLGYTYEVIDRKFDGKDLIYFGRNTEAGVIFVLPEKEIDHLVEGANIQYTRSRGKIKRIWLNY